MATEKHPIATVRFHARCILCVGALALLLVILAVILFRV